MGIILPILDEYFILLSAWGVPLSQTKKKQDENLVLTSKNWEINDFSSKHASRCIFLSYYHCLSTIESLASWISLWQSQRDKTDNSQIPLSGCGARDFGSNVCVLTNPNTHSKNESNAFPYMHRFGGNCTFAFGVGQSIRLVVSDTGVSIFFFQSLKTYHVYDVYFVIGICLCTSMTGSIYSRLCLGRNEFIGRLASKTCHYLLCKSRECLELGSWLLKTVEEDRNMDLGW